MLKLGIKVSQATVGRYMPWRPKVPSPTWRNFLQNHMSTTVAVDMFVVATATFRLLYTVLVLGHDRRKVIHFDVTQNTARSSSASSKCAREVAAIIGSRCRRVPLLQEPIDSARR